MNSRQHTLIEPPSGFAHLGLQEVWRYRDLLLLLAWRDISARFRQSIVGYGWAVLRPLITVMIYTLVFSLFVRLETEQPYVIFAFSGLIPWLYFSQALMSVTGSIVAGGAMLSKVYFPRLVLPLATVAVGLVEVILQLVVLGGVMAWYQYPPGLQLAALPLFLLIAMLTALAFGIWLTALNVKYRDVGMAMPFLIQIWMYLCPIIYPLSLVRDNHPRLYTVYSLNPMVSVIEGFRWSLLGGQAPDWFAVCRAVVVVSVVLMTGLVYFRRVERNFADII
ncbi:MAG: ABC transporter permease [Planctomycetota bacterium]